MVALKVTADAIDRFVLFFPFLGLATPAAEEAVEIDPAAAQALAQPCPCCGGRMLVIETFDAGCQPRYRPTAMRIDTS